MGILSGPPIISPAEVTAGHELLDEVRAFVARFVAAPATALDAITLWAAHAHIVDAFHSTPRLALLSPEPGSGKTRVLEVLELVVPAPMHALNASAPAVFRTIESARPTLLLDEVDALWGRRGDDSAEDLRALLNAGHRKGATIPRCVGPTHAVNLFPVFCAVALAGLGDLPDTLMSRSIVVRMRRRAPGERVESFRFRDVAPVGHDLRDRLADWTAGLRPGLDDARPPMPAGITDRPADTWEALLAIADAAGGHWPGTARAACIELCKVASTGEASLGVRLLGDLRSVFGDEDRLSTGVIIEHLVGLEEAPWGDLRGKPIDPRGLARRLGHYDVSSCQVWTDGKNQRGYRREDLYDTWARYLPGEVESESVPPVSPEALGPLGALDRRSDAPDPLAATETYPLGARRPLGDAPPLTCELADLGDLADLTGAGTPAPAETAENVEATAVGQLRDAFPGAEITPEDEST